MRLLALGIGDAGKVALGPEEVALLLSIEIGGIDRTSEVGDEHPVAGNVEGDADSLHQVRDQDLGDRLFIDRSATDRVAARRIAAVSPVEGAIFEIELEIDRLRQLIEQHLDVGAVRWALALRNVDVGAAQTAQSAFRRAFLCPGNFTKLRIDGDSNAPTRLIAAVCVTAAGLDQRFNMRAVEVRTHHTHALTVAPIKLVVFLIEMDLLWSERAAFGNNDLAILSVCVSTLDGAVVQVGNTHVGPVDVTGFRINGDTIGETAIGYDSLPVGAIRIHQMNKAGVQFEYE